MGMQSRTCRHRKGIEANEGHLQPSLDDPPKVARQATDPPQNEASLKIAAIKAHNLQATPIARSVSHSKRRSPTVANETQHPGLTTKSARRTGILMFDMKIPNSTLPTKPSNYPKISRRSIRIAEQRKPRTKNNFLLLTQRPTSSCAISQQQSKQEQSRRDVESTCSSNLDYPISNHVSQAFDLLSSFDKTTSLHQLGICLQENPHNWYCISSIPEQIKSLHLSYPALVHASSCWKGGLSPLLSDVQAHCEALAKSRSIIIEDASGTGSRSKSHTLSDVLEQLNCNPRMTASTRGTCSAKLGHIDRPLAAHNIPLDNFTPLLPSAIPVQHFLTFDRLPDTDFSMNVVPAGKIVDIHIDQGSTGLSVGIGRAGEPDVLKTKKIWILWPPTEHNFRIFEDLGRRRRDVISSNALIEPDYMLRRSQDLELGIVAVAGIEDGVFLPSGWLHATITVQGGFLAGITWIAHDLGSIEMISKVLAMDVRLAQSSRDVAGLIPFYTGFLNEVSQKQESLGVIEEKLKQVIGGWFEIEKSLREKRVKRAAWKACEKEFRRLLGAWKVLFRPWRKCELMWRSCPGCSWVHSTGAVTNLVSFPEHFWSRHLDLVTPPKYVISFL